MAGVMRQAGGLLLAAGASTRMGTPKALLRTRSGPLLVHQVREMRAAGLSPVVVVLGCRAAELQAALCAEAADLSEWQVVVNHRWEEGKCGSIRVGARALLSARRDLVLAAVDQPLAAEIIQALWGYHKQCGAALTIPEFGGRGGHPVMIRADAVHRLLDLEENEAGMRGLMRELAEERPGSVHRVALNSRWVLNDFNRPQDLIGGFTLPSESPRGSRAGIHFARHEKRSGFVRSMDLDSHFPASGH